MILRRHRVSPYTSGRAICGTFTLLTLSLLSVSLIVKQGVPRWWAAGRSSGLGFRAVLVRDQRPGGGGRQVRKIAPLRPRRPHTVPKTAAGEEEFRAIA